MAIALVANTGAGLGVNGGTTSAINTIGATLIVAVVSYYTGAAAGGPTLSDSQSNTWTALTTRSGNTMATRLYYVVNPTTNASHTFTLSGANFYSSLAILAFSGSDTASPFDVESGGVSSGSVATFQPGSLTPSQADSVFVAGDCVGSGGGTLTIDLSFTITNQVAWSGGIYVGFAGAYLVQSGGPTARNPTWTLGSSTTIDAAMAVFKPSAAQLPGDEGALWYLLSSEEASYAI
jgi:hypothetical protein